MKNSKQNTPEIQLNLKERLIMLILFRKVRRHYKNIEYVKNNWTTYKNGIQYIGVNLDLYTDSKFILVNGIPLYEINTRKFQTIKNT